MHVTHRVVRRRSDALAGGVLKNTQLISYLQEALCLHTMPKIRDNPTKRGEFIVRPIGDGGRHNWGDGDILGLKDRWKPVKLSRIFNEFAHDDLVQFGRHEEDVRGFQVYPVVRSVDNCQEPRETYRNGPPRIYHVDIPALSRRAWRGAG